MDVTARRLDAWALRWLFRISRWVRWWPWASTWAATAGLRRVDRLCQTSGRYHPR